MQAGGGWHHIAPGIGPEAQGPAAGNARIELAQGTGGGIARIGKGLLPGGRLRLVQGEEGGARHIDLAAHVHGLGHVGASQAAGDVGNGFHIAGDILAHQAIAPGGGLNQAAALIAQGNGQAIDLGLGHKGHGRVVRKRKKAANALLELPRVTIGKGVFQAQHGAGMGDRLKGAGRGKAHRMGRAVWPDQLGKAALDIRIALAQGVISGVGDGGGVLAMIAAIVLGDFSGEARQFALRLQHAQAFDGQAGGITRAHFWLAAIRSPGDLFAPGRVGQAADLGKGAGLALVLGNAEMIGATRRHLGAVGDHQHLCGLRQARQALAHGGGNRTANAPVHLVKHQGGG